MFGPKTAREGVVAMDAHSVKDGLTSKGQGEATQNRQPAPGHEEQLVLKTVLLGVLQSRSPLPTTIPSLLNTCRFSPPPTLWKYSWLGPKLQERVLSQWMLIPSRMD